MWNDSSRVSIFFKDLKKLFWTIDDSVKLELDDSNMEQQYNVGSKITNNRFWIIKIAEIKIILDSVDSAPAYN